MLSYEQFRIAMILIFAVSVMYIILSFRRTTVTISDGENMVTPASAIRSFDNPFVGANVTTDDKEKSKQYLISSDDKGNLSNTTLECTDGNITDIKNIKMMPSVETPTEEDMKFIRYPDGTLRINSHGIMFGGINTGKDREMSSGQISTLHGDLLGIVGVGAFNNRKIKLWDNVEVRSNLTVNEDLKVNRDLTVDRDLTVKNKICIGNTCIDETKLKSLIGAEHIFLKNNKGQYLSREKQTGNTWIQLRDKNTNINDSWEAWFIETS